MRKKTIFHTGCSKQVSQAAEADQLLSKTQAVLLSALLAGLFVSSSQEEGVLPLSPLPRLVSHPIVDLNRQTQSPSE